MYNLNIYNASIEKAKSLGYKEYKDPHAFMGLGFIKNRKKWIIFSPSHLLGEKRIEAQGIKDEDGLEKIGYNVKDYYLHHPEWVAFEAENERLEVERLNFEDERMMNIKEIFANAHIEYDEVDDIHEKLDQMGYDSYTLRKIRYE